MKNRIFAIFMCLMLMLGLLPTTAMAAEIVDSGECGENLTWTLDSEGTLTISGEGEMENSVSYIDPDDIYDLTTIDDVIFDCHAPWQDNSEEVRSIIIEEGVTSIGDGAFAFCYYLNEISIADSVRSIGDYAFYECNSLDELEIPEGVVNIGDYAFGRARLQAITLPESLTSIGEFAFHVCNIVNFTIPSGLTELGDYFFVGWDDLESITISKGNTAFCVDEDGALYNSNKTTLLRVPAGVEGEYIIRDGVTSIGDGAFSGCESLTGIKMPNSVTGIGDYAFSGCEDLIEIVIPNGVTEIGEHAFSNCKKLTTMEIPDGVKSINAFIDCSNLKDIKLPNGLTNLGANAFYGCNSLSEIELPDGLISIGKGAFANCENLSEIVIPDSVTSIGKLAFQNCDSLTSVEIPGSVSEIGDCLFGFCDNFKRIVVSDTNPYYSTDEFGVLFNKEKTTLVQFPSGISGGYIIPDGVRSIGTSAFAMCEHLTSVEIPDGVTSIDDGAFYSCFNLTELTIPNTVSSIGEYAFFSCWNIDSIIIPASVTSIGDAAFSACSDLVEILVDDSNPNYSDENGALYDKEKKTLIEVSSGKTMFKVPANVTNVASFAFGNCWNLNELCFEGDVPVFEEGTSVYKNETYIFRDGVTVYYPANNPTWDEVVEKVKTDVTWISYTPEEADYILTDMEISEDISENTEKEDSSFKTFMSKFGNALFCGACAAVITYIMLKKRNSAD